MIGSRKQKSAANSAPPEASGLVRVEASLLVVLLSKDPPQSHARTHALEPSGEPKCVTAPMAAKTLTGAAFRGGRAASHSGLSLRANPRPYRRDILASNRAPWRKGNMH